MQGLQPRPQRCPSLRSIPNICLTQFCRCTVNISKEEGSKVEKQQISTSTNHKKQKVMKNTSSWDSDPACWTGCWQAQRNRTAKGKQHGRASSMARHQVSSPGAHLQELPSSPTPVLPGTRKLRWLHTDSVISCPVLPAVYLASPLSTSAS